MGANGPRSRGSKEHRSEEQRAGREGGVQTCAPPIFASAKAASVNQDEIARRNRKAKSTPWEQMVHGVGVQKSTDRKSSVQGERVEFRRVLLRSLLLRRPHRLIKTKSPGEIARRNRPHGSKWSTE